MTTCQGCGLDKKLIKAHAIPQSFFVKMREEHGTPKLLTDATGTFPKSSPIGVYDEKILCRDCEDKFQIVDEYGNMVLLGDNFPQEKQTYNGQVSCYNVQDVDYKKLKLFFISVLWRASISSQKFYEKVNLGPYSQIAKDVIWNSKLGAQSEFSFIVAKFTDDSIGKVMLDPYRRRIKGVNYYHLYMYGYVIYIKVDQKNSPITFNKFEMKCNGELIIIGRELENSSEFKVMSSVLKNSLN